MLGMIQKSQGPVHQVGTHPGSDPAKARGTLPEFVPHY